MDFSSFTPFPAMTHDFIDSRGDEFHVMVARGTYDLAPSSAGTQGTHVPQLAAEQQPLVFSDRYFGEINRSSVRYESDIVQWKPRCDVIVVGSALSPTGKPVTHIDVGVRIA